MEDLKEMESVVAVKPSTEHDYTRRGLGVLVATRRVRQPGPLVAIAASHPLGTLGSLAAAASTKTPAGIRLPPVCVAGNSNERNTNRTSNANRNRNDVPQTVKSKKVVEYVTDDGRRTHRQLRDDCQYLAERAARAARREPDSPDPPPEPPTKSGADLPKTDTKDDEKVEETASTKKKERENVRPVFPGNPWYIDPARIRKSR